MTILSSPRVKYLAQGLKVVVFLSLFFVAFAAQAVNPLDVVINELAWMGTKVEGIESKNWWRYEWLELYNTTQSPISLDGWKIELYRTELDWSLELKGTVLPNGYFLIVSSDKIFSNYDFNYSNLGGKLNNNGQKIILRNAAGIIIDEINCSSGWFAGDNSTKRTMERKNPQLEGSDPNNWQTSQNAGGTPKAKNSIIVQAEPQPKPESEKPAVEEPTVEVRLQQTYPTGVVINEILPSPEGPDSEEEWIEIFNQNNFEADLSKWQIADTAGGTFTYTLPAGTKISAQGFLVINRPTSKITLNNDGDGLNLIQPDGKTIDSITYEKAPRGQSFNRIDSKWAWSITITPGSANVIPALISEAKKTELSKEEVKEAPSETKEESLKKELAAIGEQVPKEPSNSFFTPLLIGLAIALSSGIIILTLKKRIRNFDLSKKME